MRIESLQYFVVTADCRSMTLSSKILHVSQQCISKEIKLLENELGAQLFARSKAGVALTEEGTRAYHKAVPILQQFHDFALQFTSDEPLCKYTLGSYIGLKKPIDSILAIFQKLHPDVVIEEYYSSTEQLEKELPGGTIDFALRQLEKDTIDAQLLPEHYVHMILLEEPAQILINAIPANHDITCLQMAHIADYPIMFYCDSTHEIPLYQRIANRFGKNLNIVYKGNNMEKSWRLFAQKNAIAIMTKSLAGVICSDIPTRLVPIDVAIPICTILSIKSELLPQYGVDDFLAIAQTFFAQLG